MKFCIDLAQRSSSVDSRYFFWSRSEGYVRISYASDMDKLTTAMERIAHYMATQRVTH